MKRVKVPAPVPPVDPGSSIRAQQLYTVLLGNHAVVHFASSRDARAFQAEASRFVSGVLFQCNLLLVDAFTAYRLAWPYMDHRRPSAKTLRRVDATCAEHLRDAERALDRAAGHNGPNAVFFCWKDLDAVLASIRAVALELAKMYRAKSQAVARGQMDVLVQRCNALRQALVDYGQDAERRRGFRPSPYG